VANKLTIAFTTAQGAIERQKRARFVKRVGAANATESIARLRS